MAWERGRGEGAPSARALMLTILFAGTEEEVLKNAMEHAKQHGIREATPGSWPR